MTSGATVAGRQRHLDDVGTIELTRRPSVRGTLVLEPSSELGGWVVTTDGTSAKTFELLATPEAGEPRQVTFASGDGRWHLDDVGAGSYELHFIALEGTATHHIDLEAGESKTDLESSSIHP